MDRTSSNLGGLPPELELTIVAQINRPSDLKALCRVSRSLNAVAIPLLYHKVKLELTRLALPQLNGFFLSKNPGHKYTRELIIDSAHPPADEDAARTIIRFAISMLPDDQLEKLELPTSLRLDAALFMGLARNQSRISNLVCGPVSDAVMQTSRSPLCSGDWLSSLTSLDASRNVTDLHDLVGFGHIVQQAPSLSRLLLGRRDYEGDDDFWASVQDTASGPGLYVKSLFGHTAPLGNQPHMNITALSFYELDLSFADTSFLKVLDFATLKRLSTVRCPGIPAFLQHLIKHMEEKKPRLEHFTCDSYTNLDPVALTALVRQCPRLSSLHLVSPGSQAESDQIHALVLQDCHALKLLAVAVWRLDWIDYSVSGIPPSTFLNELAGKLEGLQEIALGSPPISLSAARHGLGKRYVEYLRQVCAGAALRALRILCWPTAPDAMFKHCREHLHEITHDQCDLCGLTKLRYRTSMDSFATLAMRVIQDHRASLGIPALRLLAFEGPYSGSTASARSLRMAIEPGDSTYVPRYIQQADGEPPQLVAVRVTWQELEYIDEQYAILTDF